MDTIFLQFCYLKLIKSSNPNFIWLKNMPSQREILAIFEPFCSQTIRLSEHLGDQHHFDSIHECVQKGA